MRVLLLVLMFPLAAACSSMSPKLTPSAAIPEQSSADIAGRWTGTWTGTGIFNSTREDTVRVDLVQQGDRGFGHLVMEGAIAAESVPETVRFQGLNGIRIVAEVSKEHVKLRHQLDGRLFTADMKLSDDGERMFGWMRGSQPVVGLMLTRKPAAAAPAPPPQQAAMAAPQAVEPPAKDAPQVVAMVPEQAERQATAGPAERPRQEEYLATQELRAIQFDYDKAVIRPDSADTLVSHAEWLRAHGDTVVLIEGHCDERGTAEYNVALGDRRAKAAMDYLAAYGVAPERITTVSHGKERLACSANTTECHEMNRRTEFRIKSR
jgi:peptidoglycan-associated lipoprotein